MNILLQGLPGIGKTTLVKKLSNKLQNNGIEVEGFYTEEVRTNNKSPRIGFDVVTIKDNNRKSLARKNTASDLKGPTVGQYIVHLNNFESLVLHLFTDPAVKDKKGVFIIDEIGKMELFSKDFQKVVSEIMDNKNKITVATVPLKNGPSFVQQIKQADDIKLITVTNSNRDELLDQLFNLIKEQF